MPQACPCDPALRYAACCAPLHGGLPAASAEALMRSRYAAFVLGLADYLLATWHPSTRPRTLSLDSEARWLGLDVQAVASTGLDSATVRFVARCGCRRRTRHRRGRSLGGRRDGRGDLACITR